MKIKRFMQILALTIVVTVLIPSISFAAEVFVKADTRIPADKVAHAKNAALLTAQFCEKVYNVKLEKPVELVLVSNQEDFRKALIEVLKISSENAEKFAKHNKGVSSWHIVSYYVMRRVHS